MKKISEGTRHLKRRTFYARIRRSKTAYLRDLHPLYELTVGSSGNREDPASMPSV